VRPKRDAVYFQNALHSLLAAVNDGRITERDYQTLGSSLEILHGEIDRLKTVPQTWGLLHGDLHRGNFLLHEGQIRLIDFSMCAFGHFAFDLGTCLSNIRGAFHSIFLEHYAQFFPLPPGYERLIEGYFLASYIATFSLWISDPRSQEALIQRVSYISREYALRFNRDERFWFR
jgi:Ser/Thr protein kinase RdoA (MazF antagonist)